MAVGLGAGAHNSRPSDEQRPQRPGNTIAELVAAINQEKEKVHIDIAAKIEVHYVAVFASAWRAFNYAPCSSSPYPVCIQVASH